MSKLLAIAQAVAFEKLVAGGVSMVASRKSTAGYGLYVVSGFLGFVALGVLIAAFYALDLAGHAPEIAALMTAGVVSGLALAAAITAYVVNHKRQIQRQIRQESMKDDILTHVKAVIATVDDEFGDQIRENPTMAVLLASVAGFIAADKLL